MTGNALRFEQVSFRYPASPQLFDNLCLALPSDGCTICVLGPSGSGKSTLIQLALGQIKPQAGRIVATNGILPVFQDFDQLVLPWFSVRSNVTWAAPPEAERNAHEVLAVLEILPHAKTKTFRLSAGQRQRTALARALCYQPPLLLLDEPLANVDRVSVHRLVPRMRDYLRRCKTSVLWVTHSLEEAALASDAAWVLHNDDPPKVVHRDTRSNDDYLAMLRGVVS